jgi:4-amino-4-deoxy-L-arabinose transferase-like glycosyltransferase
MNIIKSINKRYHLRRYDIVFFALLIVATLLRLALISNDWPTMNSDEAVMGLMAKHMAGGQGIPLVIYGQAYMGSLEAMLGSVFYHLFGVSIFALRLGLLTIFILFLCSMYLMTRLLYDQQLALIICGLLCLGTPEIFLHQLFAAGGYPEIVWLGAMLFLIATLLAISAYCDDPEDRRARRRRLCLFGVYGLLAGLGIWSDPLIIPVIAASGLLLLRFDWREVCRIGGGLLLVGLIIGLAPLIKHNLEVPWQQSTLVSMLHLQQGRTGGSQPVHSLFLIKQQISSTLLYALPAITGANPLCSTTSLLYFGPVTHHTLICSLRQGVWSLGYFILGGAACCMAIYAIWHYHQQTKQDPAPYGERRMYVLQWARLSLLLCASLVILAYLSSPASAIYAGPTTRYLVCLDIVVPALLWPLWSGLHHGSKLPFPTLNRTIRLICLAGFLVIAITLLIGTVATFQQIPGTQRTYQNQQQLTHDLLRIGATRVYTEYWTCNTLILLSNERIICSNLTGNLQPGHDRFLPYRTLVRSTPGATYVFPSNAPQLAAIEQKIHQYHIPYKRYAFDHYVVYVTPKPVQ